MARLPYLGEDDLAPGDRELLARPIYLNRLLAHSPGAARRFSELGRWICYDCRLDPRLRELAILQVGYLARSPYEYSHHVKIGRDFGVSDDDIRALEAETRGEESSLPGLDRAVLRAAREITERGALDDATFAILQESLDEERLVDLILIAAFYNAVVRLLGALDIDVEPEYAPFLEEFPLP